MDALFQSSPLWIRIGVPYGVAAIIALFIKFFPENLLYKLSIKLPCFSPNWISLWGFLIYWIGGAGYIYCWYNLVSQAHHSALNDPRTWLIFTVWLNISTIGASMDTTDGTVARLWKKHRIYRSPRAKRFGKYGDPALDKLKYLPMIVWFSLRGVINLWVTIWIVVWDVLGTLIRNPINIGVRMWWSAKKRRQQGPLKFWMDKIGRRLARGSKATNYGKTKSTIQAIGLAICMLFQVYLMLGSDMPTAVYILAAALGVFSVLSRVRIHKRVDRVIDDPSLIFEPSKI
ncbi:MAG: hypothetical protein PHS79_05780 [Patescibacteria group bacterium]|nr:hypothetical protein [Patescibacteria group bacterium]